jgi:hypothetical protein
MTIIILSIIVINQPLERAPQPLAPSRLPLDMLEQPHLGLIDLAPSP